MSNNSVSLGAHLKKQNVFFYLSAVTSVLIIALMFVPWIVEPEKASILDLIMQCWKHTDLMIFMLPVVGGILLVHVLYLVSLFRPGHDPQYYGTVSVLLSALLFFLFIFATDMGYSTISVAKGNYTDSFMVFIGAQNWLNTPLDTWLANTGIREGIVLFVDRFLSLPVLWLALAAIQTLFAKVAHKKEVISYV